MSHTHKIWRKTVVRLIGGFHEVGLLFVSIHDDGICGGWDRIIKFDFHFVPPEVNRCTMVLSRRQSKEPVEP